MSVIGPNRYTTLKILKTRFGAPELGGHAIIYIMLESACLSTTQELFVVQNETYS